MTTDQINRINAINRTPIKERIIYDECGLFECCAKAYEVVTKNKNEEEAFKVVNLLLKAPNRTVLKMQFTNQVGEYFDIV